MVIQSIFRYVFLSGIQCNFKPGDGSGGSEIDIGGQGSVANCISACQNRKKQNPLINGITMLSSGSSSECYCETAMTGANSDTKWKTCFLQSGMIIFGDDVTYLVSEE